ncbi:homoserine kinase [Hydrogenothermus marinus]|uniref:Homoserine kinase n=1 Tax=Hydrogenothermus marinus TaxID=133270 RepID=A0A3M0BKA5_9AQUI|nr:homoserine kinase [Hydrogenothermus marinus]RMA97893.1 homoserine kinase [Hydrogenothermus marinus]
MLKIKVPATSANLGAGFDTLGVALNLYNEFIVEESDTVQIETYPKIPEFENPDKNLFVKVLKKTCEYIGNDFHGVKLTQKINVPVSRGLGSSATAIVGAIVAAFTANKKVLTDEEFFNIAYQFEPHPDNLLPALKGGFITACVEDKKTYYSKIPFPEELKFVVVIPDFELSTEKARKVLPEKVSLEDAVFNVQRVSLLISSLVNKDFDLLKVAMNDRLHEPYRKKLIPNFDKVVENALNSGAVGVSLSGAGSCMIALAKENFEDIGKSMVEAFNEVDIKAEYKILEIDKEGVQVEF